MPRFGKDKNARNEELDRQAAEEVERLTRRGAPPPTGNSSGPFGVETATSDPSGDTAQPVNTIDSPSGVIGVVSVPWTSTRYSRKGP